MSGEARCWTHGWRRGYSIRVCMTRTHFKVLTVLIASCYLWDPDTCSWQTTCVHRAAGTINMNNGSCLMACLAVLLAFTRDPAAKHFNLHLQRQQQNAGLPSLFSLQCAGKVAALVGSNSRSVFQCLSCSDRYSCIARCLDWILLRPLHFEKALMPSFLHTLSLLITWYLFLYHIWELLWL